MGESPAPLVKHASKRGTEEADQFTKSEGMYAISRAITDGIPFLGGEPTRTEQVQALERRGFTPTDIAFAYLVGGLSQSVRSGDLASSSDPKLAESFAQWSRAFSDQYHLPPLSLEDFETRYQAVFGVELTHDAECAKRSEPGTASPVALLNQTDMVTRDEHLLATIENELNSKKRVLVVYGGSHWTTLSQALQRRLGKPKIKLPHLLSRHAPASASAPRLKGSGARRLMRQAQRNQAVTAARCIPVCIPDHLSH